MGFLPSHVDQGVVFGLLGAWHLANALVSFVKNPRGFTHRTWIPVDRLPGAMRCAELWIMLAIVLAFLATQASHTVQDLRDGFIRTDHLQRFQHITFGMFFLVYIVVALISEGSGRLPLPRGALQGTFALAFLMELLVFHLGHHPGDNLESFVHMLMQIILAMLVAAMLLEVLFPHSFLISICRCMLLLFKGSWFFHIGLLINFPATFAPAGCDFSKGFPHCSPGLDLLRAKSLQVLVFGWHVLSILICTYAGYACLVGYYVGSVEKDHYQRLPTRLETIPELEIKSVADDELRSMGPRSLSRRRSSKGMATP